MIPRSECESLPKPTPSPCTRVPFSVSVFHCRRVVCACSAGAVGLFLNLNHFRPQCVPNPQNYIYKKNSAPTPAHVFKDYILNTDCRLLTASDLPCGRLNGVAWLFGEAGAPGSCPSAASIVAYRRRSVSRKRFPAASARHARPTTIYVACSSPICV